MLSYLLSNGLKYLKYSVRLNSYKIWFIVITEICIGKDHSKVMTKIKLYTMFRKFLLAQNNVDQFLNL